MATAATAATFALALALGGGLLVACASHGRSTAADRGWVDRQGPPRPTLEEIFLEPPLFGTPPTIRSLSADGSWLAFAWSEAGERVAPAPGVEQPDDARPVVRLVATASTTAGVGKPLEAYLPAAEADASADAKGDDEEDDDDRGTRVRSWGWSHRGARLALARGSDVWVLDPASGALQHVVHATVADAKDAKDSDAAEDEDDEAERGDAEPKAVEAPRISRVAFSPDDGALHVHADGELYVRSLAGPSRALALSELDSVSAAIDANASRLEWSDDLGVAFGTSPAPVKASDEEDEDEGGEASDASSDEDAQAASAPLHVWHVAEHRGVTLEGVEDEEWLESTSLSPDGRFVFGAAWDREDEPPRTLVPDYLTERVSTRTTRRFWAEDGPSPFELYVWDTDTGARREVFPAPEPALASDGDEATADEAGAAKEKGAKEGRREGDWWLRTVGWAPQVADDDPARFCFERTSADHRMREVWVWSAAGTRRVWHERDEAWVGGRVSSTRWSADGERLLIGSESSELLREPGRGQVFAVDPTGATDPIQLTDFGGEVWRFSPLADGALLVEGLGADPAYGMLAIVPAPQVQGRFRPEAQIVPVPLGRPSGARASRGGDVVVYAHESLFEPSELWCSTDANSRRLTATTPEEFGEVDWVRPERIEVKARDGARIRAHVYLPPGTSLEDRASGPPRATIVFVHGAGYLQNVSESMTEYPLNLMFHSRLATMGYPVIDVDYRGSAGYGRDFRTAMQYHLGGKDLTDIDDVVDHLVARGLVDPERVGIYGGSYGGFMTMMALFTAPDRWAVGAALRSVTDWRTYNPNYTQPRLGRPSTHPEAYAKSSPLDLVGGLKDPLLVLHGMVDSNVFAQDSIRLIEALIDQGSEFDAMLYPSQGHGFEDGPHWLDEYRRIERYLTEHLGPPLRDDA